MLATAGRCLLVYSEPDTRRARPLSLISWLVIACLLPCGEGICYSSVMRYGIVCAVKLKHSRQPIRESAFGGELR